MKRILLLALSCFCLAFSVRNMAAPPLRALMPMHLANDSMAMPTVFNMVQMPEYGCCAAPAMISEASYQNVKLNDNLRISRFNCSSELFHPSEKYSNYINGTGVLCVGTGNDGVDRDRGTEADSRWPTSDSRPATAG